MQFDLCKCLSHFVSKTNYMLNNNNKIHINNNVYDSIWILPQFYYFIYSQIYASYKWNRLLQKTFFLHKLVYLDPNLSNTGKIKFLPCPFKKCLRILINIIHILDIVYFNDTDLKSRAKVKEYEIRQLQMIVLFHLCPRFQICVILI